MSYNENILDLFRRLGALQEGHFLLSSGLHSSGYLQSALVLQHSDKAEALGIAIAEKVKDLSPRVVLAPALGGIIIGHEVGRALGIRTVFTERQDGVLVLRRGFHLSVGEAVVVVEDVITTGGSTRETIELAQASGANVVGAAAIINRSSSDLNLGVPFSALGVVSLPTYQPNVCPQCIAGTPAVKPGSRQS